MTQQSHYWAYTLRKPQLKKTHVPQCSQQHYLQQLGYIPRCPSVDEWIKKLWYIHAMECYSAIKKNTFESVLMRWMNLVPIIQSEVSQKEKYKYHILMNIHGIQKDGTNEIIYKTAMETQTQRTDLWTQRDWGGRRGWGVESNMETYTNICKIDSQWEFIV